MLQTYVRHPLRLTNDHQRFLSQLRENTQQLYCNGKGNSGIEQQTINTEKGERIESSRSCLKCILPWILCRIDDRVSPLPPIVSPSDLHYSIEIETGMLERNVKTEKPKEKR